MVGGVIIGVTKQDGRAHINVADCPHYPKHGIKAVSVDGCPYPDTCCVYTDAVRLDGGGVADIQVGDALWWQGGFCYWTPKDNRTKDDALGGVDYDIRLTKLGYSH